MLSGMACVWVSSANMYCTSKSSIVSGISFGMEILMILCQLQIKNPKLL